MVDPTPAFEWLTDRWRSFYKANPVEPPERFGRREFGFIFFGQKFFLRHTGFRRREDLQKFVVGRAPAHAYYSTAFYKEPAAAKMVEKGWMGAELIFDLDADHVPGSEKLPYDEQLAKVKDHFVRLVDEFLYREFGFPEDEVILTFSGGRGYHAHVVSPDAMQLSSPERREIVDYITGTRLVPETLFREKTLTSRRHRKYVTKAQGLLIPRADAPGWGGRVNREFQRFVLEIQDSTREDAVRQLVRFDGIGEKKALLISEALRTVDEQSIREGQLFQAVMKRDMVRHLIAQILREHAMPMAKGETDEPVTSDTKRLIRMPGSLHGKTGLKVVVLSRDELDAFDPLHDAVAFGDEPVSVEVTRPLKFSLHGESYDLAPGRSMRLPEAAAAMAMARGNALPA